MRFSRTSRTLASWMAVLAILLAALAPTISHALGAERTPAWVEVCSSIGSKWVQPGGEQEDQVPAPATAHAFEHCAYCVVHANALAIPSTQGICVPPATVGDMFTVAAPSVPRRAGGFSSAQPRAPPPFS